MKRVTILLGYPANAHLTAAVGWPDLVRRMRHRGYRFDGGYWSVPLPQVADVAEELRCAGYDVLIQTRGAA